MSDRNNSTPPAFLHPNGGDAPRKMPIPEVCFFRHSALLTLPEVWRSALTLLGPGLYDWTLETSGVAPSFHTSLDTTQALLHAIARDLRTAGEQLAELGWSPEESALGEEEMRLCKLAGRLAVTVEEIAGTLTAGAG